MPVFMLDCFWFEWKLQLIISQQDGKFSSIAFIFNQAVILKCVCICYVGPQKGQQLSRPVIQICHVVGLDIQLMYLSVFQLWKMASFLGSILLMMTSSFILNQLGNFYDDRKKTKYNQDSRTLCLHSFSAFYTQGIKVSEIFFYSLCGTSLPTVSHNSIFGWLLKIMVAG